MKSYIMWLAFEPPIQLDEWRFNFFALCWYFLCKYIYFLRW